MKNSIYNLEYDFIRQNGQHLVFYKKNHQPIEEKDLANLQVRMMVANRIPRLLPMQVEEIDFQVKIHYLIDSKRMLRFYLKEQPLSMNEYFTLFLNLIRTIEESNVYMLNEQNYILNEEFIFIGRDINDIYLTYLPLESMDRNKTILEELKQLLIDIAGEVHGLDGNSFKTIVNYLKSSSFSLSGIKEVLRGLQHRSESLSSYSPQGQNNPSVNPSLETNVHHRTNSLGQVIEKPPSYEDLVKNKKPKGNKKKKQKKKLPPLTSREVIYLFAAMALFIAIVWKVYEIIPVSWMLITSYILSAGILVTGLIYWKVWRPGVKYEVIEEEVSEEDINKRKKQTEKEVAVTQHSQTYEQPKPGYQQVFYSYPQTPDSSREDYHSSNQHQQATFVPPVNPFDHPSSGAMLEEQLNDETILLDDMGNDDVVNTFVRQPIIKVNRNGKIEQIPIKEDHFIIGRNKKDVHYTEDSVGISRLHIEFIRIDNQCGVKDLGSKNGTKLNDKPMVPYKIYALKDHDKISLGNIVYTFQWSPQE